MFRDREDAAIQLAQRLKKYKNESVVIIAIPRGAVPMGYIIARELGSPLEIVLIKKIGHPDNPEFAIGAVSTYGTVVSSNSGISKEYIEQETKRIKELLQTRYKLYVGNRNPINLTNKTVIVVDDGIATGNTMQATIEVIKKSNPKQIVVAVPVAHPAAISKLSSQVDNLICLFAPEYFEAVGQFYRHFPQVSDLEVISLLQHK